jgi:hypothetical protein
LRVLSSSSNERLKGTTADRKVSKPEWPFQCHTPVEPVTIFFFFWALQSPFAGNTLKAFGWLTDPKHKSNASLLGLQRNNNLLLEKRWLKQNILS